MSGKRRGPFTGTPPGMRAGPFIEDRHRNVRTRPAVITDWFERPCQHSIGAGAATLDG